jgi:hypothetical protein
VDAAAIAGDVGGQEGKARMILEDDRAGTAANRILETTALRLVRAEPGAVRQVVEPDRQEMWYRTRFPLNLDRTS